MAPRQAFLPRRDPEPAPRRSPGRSGDRRKPGTRRNPQPWRPAPNRPTPTGPLFDPPKRKKAPAFGRRSPLNPPSPVWRKAAGKLARGLMPRLVPGLGWGLMAWDAWEAYDWYMRPGPEGTPEYTNHIVCRTGPSNPTLPGPRYCFTGSDRCVTQAPFPNTEWHTTRKWYWKWWTTSVSRNRYETLEGWYFPNPPSEPLEGDPTPLPGEPVITPQPGELPYPFPYSPTPFPVHPPLERPRPQPRPRPAIKPLPVGRGPQVPSIDTGPGVRPVPGTHVLRPPTPDEREKKKRIGGTRAQRWLAVLERGLATFTETDDVVSAIYKALPWKQRRWKGRDGVWRDRDATTASRLNRLYETAYKIDVDQAIDLLIDAHRNVQDQDLTDRVYGELGNTLKRRSRDLGDDGLWAGSRGLGAQTPLSDNWDEAYLRLQREAIERERRVGRAGHWYRTTTYNRETNRWETELRERPRTQIPWYKQRSQYDRDYQLTYGANAAKYRRPGYFYGPNNLPSPVPRTR